MRSLKSVYSDYEDSVHFIVIGQDGGESAGALRSFMESNGYAYTTIPYDRDVNTDYRITSQASAVAMDSNGVIAYRSSYSSAEDWRGIFDTLLGG